MILSPSRRILAIWCERLAIDRWHLSERLIEGESIDADPLALIVETAHGPRITAANTAGALAGAQSGMMLADARTLCPSLAVAPGDPTGDLAFLEQLAIWAQRWGPWSALDHPDGVIVDVSGVAHLFGGEAGLLADARTAFVRRRLTVRLAIAPTAGAAWALAHYGPRDAILQAEDDPAHRLAQLPVAALRLDADTITLLKRLGLKRLGDLQGVHRDALVRRFRNRRSATANPLIRMDQLLGHVPEPMLPVIPVKAPMVQRRLMEPIRHRELLERVLADLAVDMVRVLDGRGMGVRRLELGMWKVDGNVVVQCLEVSAPTRDPTHLASLFGRKLEAVDAGFGIELVRLRASWAEPMTLEQRDLETAAEQHGTSLAAFVDRLTVRLGPDAVRRPTLRASHIPERAQGWQGPLEPDASVQDGVAFQARPIKLLDRPELISVIYETPDGLPRRFRWRGKTLNVLRVEGPERIAPEWWREPSSTRLRDYYRIEDVRGCRYWIYRSGIVGDGRGGLPAWFLQGLFE